MKKLNFLCILLISCVSCCPKLYEQIGTVVSDSVYLQDDGNFEYVDPDINISYDFWSEYGKFAFVVTNKSDKDILLDMSQSYFINNGKAFDYFENTSYYSTNNIAHSVSASKVDDLNIFRQVSSVVNDKVTTGRVEREVVCIPARSYKVFSKFQLMSSAYRSCGFPRDPSNRETVIKSFEINNSPVVFENRLVFYFGNERVPVINKFYLGTIQNIAESECTKKIEMYNCDGSPYPVTVNSMASKNRYYISYNEADVTEQYGVQNNDRTERTWQLSCRKSRKKKM